MLNTIELSIKIWLTWKSLCYAFLSYSKLETFKKYKVHVLSDKTMKTVGI